MFFSKFVAPAVAFLGAATSVFATPISQPIAESGLAKRDVGEDIYNTCYNLYNDCTPYINQLTEVDVDVEVTVGIIADLFTKTCDDLDYYTSTIAQADVSVDIDIEAVVEVAVNVIVDLVVALDKCDSVTATIWAQVDAFISVYLKVLAVIDASIYAKITTSLPALCIDIFVRVKLSICIGLLGLVQIS